MQSFKEFMSARRQRSSGSLDAQQLTRSRLDLHTGTQQQQQGSSSVPSSSTDLQGPQAAGALALSSSMHSLSLSAAAPPGQNLLPPGQSAAAAEAHTVTTVCSSSSRAGSRYLSPSTSTAAGSRARLSDGLNTALQQLLSPQRSAAALSNCSSVRVLNTANPAGAAVDAAGPSIGQAAAAAVGPLQGGHSSKSLTGLVAAHVNSSSSRLQPLSAADALPSPRSRSMRQSSGTLGGGHTPTGARTPVGSSQHPVAAAAAAAAAAALHAATGAGASATADGALTTPVVSVTGAAWSRQDTSNPSPAAAAGAVRGSSSSSWRPEQSQAAVLQEAAARAAALHRSTTLKSQASQAHSVCLGPQAEVPQASAAAAGVRAPQEQQPQQQQLLQQPWQQVSSPTPQPQGQGLHDSQVQQQLHDNHWDAVQQQQQQQQVKAGMVNQLQQQRGGAAVHSQDLDHCFDNNSNNSSSSVQDMVSPQGSMAHKGPPAAGCAAKEVATALPAAAAARRKPPSRPGLGCQHALEEPYSLEDAFGSSDGCSSSSSSSGGSSTECTEPHRALPRQQQHHKQRHKPSRHHQQPQQGHQQQHPMQQRMQQGQRRSEAHQRMLDHHDVQVASICGAIPDLSHTARQRDAHKTPRHSQQQRSQRPLLQEPSLPSTQALLSSDLSCVSLNTLATCDFTADGFLAFSSKLHTPTISKQAEISKQGPMNSSSRTTTTTTTTTSMAAAAAEPPRPRSTRPRPSIAQTKRQHGPRRPAVGAASAGTAAAGSDGGGCGSDGGSCGSMGAVEEGVFDEGCRDSERWCGHGWVVAQQQVQELQQQNDALVRVLERERQQHAATRQQVSELQLSLDEARVEWDVKLQVLRQEHTALRAKLRRVMADSTHQDTFDAYDAALAAAAAQVQEAQAAAAQLAGQAAELELHVQQLQLVTGTNGTNNGSEGGGGGGGGGGSFSARLPGSVAAADGLMDSPRADGVAVVRAVASAEARSPVRHSPCRNAFAAGSAPDCSNSSSSRGVRALRQHQVHLEQQLAKSSEQLSQLQRDNIKLLRYKRQFEVAAQSLQGNAAAKAAAEAQSQGAGLKATAAAERADRLAAQAKELLQQNQQLKAESIRLQLHLQLAQQQQQQQQQQQPCAEGLPDSARGSHTPSSSNITAVVAELLTGCSSGPIAALAGTGTCLVHDAAACDAVATVTTSSRTHGTTHSGKASLHSVSTVGAGDQGRAGGKAWGIGVESGLMSPSATAATVEAVSTEFEAGSELALAPAAATAAAGAAHAQQHPAAAAAAAPTAGGGAAAASGAASTRQPSSGQQQGESSCSSGADREALRVVQQLQAAIPYDAVPVQGQLASLVAAIQAGVQERQALAAQGKVLLELLVGGS